MGHQAGSREWVNGLWSLDRRPLVESIYNNVSKKRDAQYSSCNRRVFTIYLSDGITSLLCAPQRDIRDVDIRGTRRGASRSKVTMGQRLTRGSTGGGQARAREELLGIFAEGKCMNSQGRHKRNRRCTSKLG